MLWLQKSSHSGCSQTLSLALAVLASTFLLPPSSVLLPLSGGGYGVYDLHNPVQGRVSTNGHISATEVIVD